MIQSAASLLRIPHAPPTAASSRSGIFVRGHRMEIVSCQLFLGTYALVMTLVPLWSAVRYDTPVMAIVALSNSFLLGSMWLPLFYFRAEYGWGHPLVFRCLVGLPTMFLAGTSLMLWGLPRVGALPEYTEEETHLLYAYGNFVGGLSCLSTYAGYHFGPRWQGFRFAVSEGGTWRFWAVISLVLATSLTALALYIKVSGGLNIYMLNLTRGTGLKLGFEDTAGPEALGHYVYVIKLGLVAAMIAVARAEGALRSPLVWIVCLYGSLSGYLTMGKRGDFVYAIMVLGLIWILRNRKVPRVRLLIAAGACFLIFSLMTLYRTSNWSRTDEASFDFLQDADLSFVTRSTTREIQDRAANNTYLPVLAKVPGEVGLLYGRTYLERLYSFVPRKIWQEKPRGIDVLAAQTFYGVGWGLPPGGLGEAYWNFGLPGVVVIYFLYGSLLRWFASCLERHPRSTAIIVVYACSIFYLDPSHIGFRFWLYAVVPALVILKAAGYFRGLGIYRPHGL